MHLTPQDTTIKVSDSRIDITLIKRSEAWWPRVTAQPQKPQWLKIDFDRWRSLEDDLSDLDDQTAQRTVQQDYPDASDHLHRAEFGFRPEQARLVYLLFYNLFQFVGFLYVLLVLAIRYSHDGPDSISSAFATVGNAIKFCQLLQYLEVMHPLFGYTSGGALVPFLQVTARNFVLFVMIDAEERMHAKPVVFYLFVVWSLIEVVRYPYYMSALVNREIGLLTWLRYTIWIPLYPFGILCESIVLLRNLPYFEETGRFSAVLPNVWNWTFDMPLFMKVYMLALALPGTYFVMNHMRKARSKKLGPSKAWKRA